MAIDPNILLQRRTIDLGQVLNQGLQAYQAFSNIRSQREEEARQRRLQPLQEQVLKAQVAAIPGEQEDLARKRQLQAMKMNATADFMLAKKIEPLVASGKWDDALKLVNSDKTISDETKGLASSVLENKDTLGAISLLNSAYENGYSIGGIERPTLGKVSTRTVLDPATNELKIGRFDDQGNFLNFVEGVAPRPTAFQESGAAIRERETDKRIRATLDSARRSGISEEKLANLESILATGDLGAGARYLESVTTGRGLNVTAFRALFPDQSRQADRAIALATREMKTIGKDAPEIARQSLNASESIASQIGLYERALQLIDEGAGTGPVEALFPAIKDASVELEQLQGILALEALGSTNLTPVSNADIQLLKDNAIPKLDKGFKAWAENKISALRRAQLFHNQRASYFQTGEARYEDWLNPQNWSQGTFRLIPSANLPGGAGRATNIEIQRGNVPNLRESIPGSNIVPPSPNVYEVDF